MNEINELEKQVCGYTQPARVRARAACTRAAITNFEILLLPITSIRLGTDLNPNINLKLQQQQQQQLVWSTYARVRTSGTPVCMWGAIVIIFSYKNLYN